jgi:hypothetical protein
MSLGQRSKSFSPNYSSSKRIHAKARDALHKKSGGMIFVREIGVADWMIMLCLQNAGPPNQICPPQRKLPRHHASLFSPMCRRQ